MYIALPTYMYVHVHVYIPKGSSATCTVINVGATAVSPGVHPTVGELTTTYTSSSTREGGGGSGMGPALVPAPAVPVHASPPSPSLGAADAHHFRVSIDLRSLHNLSLPPSLVAFLKCVVIIINLYMYM